MAVNPAQLMQMSRLNGIRNFLTNQQARNTIAATASKYAPSSGMGGQQAVDPGLRDTGSRSIPHGNTPVRTVPDAGLFNTPAPLPTQSGPPDPTIEPTPIPGAGGGPPMEGPTPGPQGGLLPAGPGVAYTPGTSVFNAPIPGEHWLGPTLLGINPMTGNPVYNPIGFGQFPGGTRVTSSGNTAGGSTGGGGNIPGYASAGAASYGGGLPNGHNANYWVF